MDLQPVCDASSKSKIQLSFFVCQIHPSILLPNLLFWICCWCICAQTILKYLSFLVETFFINKMETESQRLLGVLPCSLTQIGVLFIDYYISKDRLISLPLHCLEQSSILLASRGFFHWLFMHEFCFVFLLFSWMGELFLSCLITDWCDGEDLE